MQATVDGTIIAESDNTIEIEGTPYFPPEDVNSDMLEKSDTPYTCPWKGEAQYFNIITDEQAYEDAAWSYPEPKDSSIEKFGHDFAKFVAFGADKIEVA